MGASLAIIANLGVAVLFALAYLAIALAYPARRAGPLGFAISYAVGALTPLAELILPHAPYPAALRAVSYLSFAAALAAMAVSLCIFRGTGGGRRIGLLLAGATLAAAAVLPFGRPGQLSYELLYQAPFAAATAASAAVLFSTARGQAIDRILGCIFAVISLHFLVKPFLALALGVGTGLAGYVASTYALVSQVMTGFLLVAAGLGVLLLVLDTMLREERAVSQTDPLTGILNRRGLLDAAGPMLRRAAQRNLPAGVILCDLDRLKQINDQHGHATGDLVIRDFAAKLCRVLRGHPAARLGGEEFVALVTGDAALRVHDLADGLRAAAAVRTLGLPAYSVSIGVTRLVQGDSLDAAIARADRALYAAKRAGRDQVVDADVVIAAAGGRPGQ